MTTSTNIIQRVSTTATGVAANYGSYSPAITADGRYVAFYSYATNLYSGGTDSDADVFIKDTVTGAITHVAKGTIPGNQSNPISTNGRYLTFISSYSNLVTGDTNWSDDAFVYDTQTQTIRRISTGPNNEQAYAESSMSTISANGMYAAILMYRVGGYQIYLKNLSTGAFTRIGDDRISEDTTLSISGDGRFITYSSFDTSIVGNDTNGAPDIFLYDAQADATQIITTGINGAQANRWSYGSVISSNGRHVLFNSSATNLTEEDVRGGGLFLKDLQSGSTRRILYSAGGMPITGNATISGDGRYVAFMSELRDLVDDDTNGYADAFVMDTISGNIRLISRSSTGVVGNNNSGDVSISDNGRYITFTSRANNLVADDNNNAADVFVVENPFSLSGTSENRPPVVSTPQPDKNWIEGTAYTYTISGSTFTDADGDVLIYSARLASGAALPTWLNFNDTTRTFTGTAPTASEDYTIRVTARDTSGATATDEFVFYTPPADTAGNTFDAARVVTLDATQRSFPGWIGNGDADDYYKFTLSQRSNFQLSLRPLSANADVILYNRDGGLLATSDGSGTSQELISRPYLDAGTYYARIYQGVANASTNYVLFMTAGASANRAPTVSTPQADRNWTEGTAFTYTMPGNTFTDADGDVLTYSARLASGAALPTWLRFNDTTRTFTGTAPAASEDYTIRVTARDASGATATDEFVFYTPPADTAGNTLAAARVVTLDATQRSFPGWIGNSDTDDYYKFTLNQRSNFQLSLRPLSADADVKLYNRDGGLLATSDGSGTSQELISRPYLDAGTYYARVYQGVANARTNYVLFMTAGASANRAPTVSTPQPDRNWTEGTAFTYTMPGNTFTDADGDVLTYSARLASGAALPTWLRFNDTTRTFTGTAPAASEDYTIRVTARDTSGATATDEFVFYTPPADTAGNTFDAARVVTLDATQRSFPGWIGNGDADDYYKFTLSQRSNFQLNLRPLSADADVKLYNRDGGLLATSDGSGTSQELISRPYLDAGTYYARVYQGVANASTNYVLFMTAGASANRAPTVSTPQPDRNWTEGTAFTYTMPGNTFTDADGDVLTYSARLASGAALPTWLRFNDTTRTFTGTAPAASEDYTIRVTARDSSGALASDDVEFYTPSPDRAGNSTTLAMNLGILGDRQSVTEWIGNADSDDYYKFTVADAGKFRLTLSETADDIDIQLLDTQGEFLVSTTNDYIMRNLESGDYYVRIRPINGNASTDYRIDMAILASPYFIDALAGRVQVWGSEFPYSQIEGNDREVLTYGWLTNDYRGSNWDSHGGTVFTELGEDQQSLAISAMRLWSEVTGISFEESDNIETANLRFGGTNMQGAGGFANFPSATNGSNIYINTESGDWNAVSTYAHEMGHALGLTHPGEYHLNSEGIYEITSGTSNMPEDEDNKSNTIMSYIGNRQNTLGDFDIAAIQYLYGPNPNERTDDNVYAMAALTHDYIWDGAGADTISARQCVDATHINLRGGSWSWVGNKSDSILSNGQYFIGYGTVIENAIGGSGNDTLIGNGLDNVLTGNAGADTLTGNGGADKFLFQSPSNGADSITDFTSGTDKILVVAANFGLVAGNPAILRRGNTLPVAAGATAQFLYNNATGALWFDRDGTDTVYSSVQIARLTGPKTLVASDLQIVAA